MLNPDEKITSHQIRMMEEVIDRFLRDLPYISKENPHLALEFFKLLRKTNKKYLIIKNLNQDLITDAVEILFREMPRGYRDLFSEMRYEYEQNPQYPIEYLRLVNELIQFNPDEKITSHQIRMMEEVIDRFLRDLPYISKENPHLALEFFKLLRNTNKIYHATESFHPKMLEEALEQLFERLFIGSKDYELAIQYLQLLSEISESFSIQRSFSSKLAERLIHKLARGFRRLAKENNQLALQSLKLLVKFDDKVDLSKLLAPFPDLNRLYKNDSEHFVIYLDALTTFMNYEKRY